MGSRSVAEDARIAAIKCPAGSYLRDGERKATWLREQLAIWEQEEGYRALPALGDAYTRTGTSTWCSNNWPKPKRCYADGSINAQHGYKHHNADKVSAKIPPRTVYGHLGGKKIEFIRNYKAATSTVAGYMECLLSTAKETDAFGLSLMNTRDPIDRFVSGVGEMLQRYVNDRCPGDRACGFKNNSTPLLKAQNNTLFWPAWAEFTRQREQRLDDSAEALNPPMDALAESNETAEALNPPMDALAESNETAEALHPLLDAFVDDRVCCHRANAIDHLLSQSLFATYAQNGLNMTIPVAELTNLKLLVSQWVTYGTARDFSTSKHAVIFQRCDMERHNVAELKEQNVPSSEEMRAALSPRMVRELCRSYYQDFLCFDLALPDECLEMNFKGYDPGSRLPLDMPPPAPPAPPPPAAPPAPPALPALSLLQISLSSFFLLSILGNLVLVAACFARSAWWKQKIRAPAIRKIDAFRGWLGVQGAAGLFKALQENSRDSTIEQGIDSPVDGGAGGRWGSSLCSRMAWRGEGKSESETADASIMRQLADKQDNRPEADASAPAHELRFLLSCLPSHLHASAIHWYNSIGLRYASLRTSRLGRRATSYFNYASLLLGGTRRRLGRRITSCFDFAFANDGDPTSSVAAGEGGGDGDPTSSVAAGEGGGGGGRLSNGKDPAWVRVVDCED